MFSHDEAVRKLLETKITIGKAHKIMGPQLDREFFKGYNGAAKKYCSFFMARYVITN